LISSVQILTMPGAPGEKLTTHNWSHPRAPQPRAYRGADAQAGGVLAGAKAHSRYLADAHVVAAASSAYVSGAELRVDGGGEVPGRVAVMHPQAADQGKPG
jgi:hypothetical protein